MSNWKTAVCSCGSKMSNGCLSCQACKDYKAIGLKVSMKMKGKKLSESHKAALSAAKTGKKLSEEHKDSLRRAKIGKHPPNWIEDRTKLKKTDRRGDPAYREWRNQVWLRDKWKCKIANPDCLGKIEAHHILGWTEYPELRYKINNGITLCHAHHPRKRAEEKRLSPYFQELVSVSKE